MENQSKEFVEILDRLNQEKWSEVYQALKDVKGVTQVAFNVYPPDETLKKFGLTKDVSFSVINDNGKGKMGYYFKGIQVDPDCYYVRPDNHVEVPTLRILQECVAQDTHRPDIKKLEVKEETN